MQNLDRVLDACTTLCACGMTPPPTSGVAQQPALLEALVQACDRHRRTALHHAAFAGSTSAVAHLCRVLQTQKLSVDRVDHCGWTALHLACAAGRDGAVEALAATGASVSRQDALGWTPLHYAAMVRTRFVAALRALRSRRSCGQLKGGDRDCSMRQRALQVRDQVSKLAHTVER